jgi:multiple sugar transport system substrate-binding protein
MRKFVAILCALTLMIAMLAGCNGGAVDPEPTPEDTRTWTEMLEDAGELTDEIKERMLEEARAASRIESAFVDHDQKGDLIIYMPPGNRFMLSFAVQLYKDTYPNVNVMIQEADEDDWNAYSIQLTTELVAGRGPDIIFPPFMFDADINKMANAGAFLDLNELIEQDADFSLDDYVKGVIDSGIYRDKLYVIPYGYDLPIFIASSKNVNEIGFNMSQTGDIFSLINEIVRTLPNAQSNPNFGTMFWANGGIWSQIRDRSSVRIVDFETNTVLPDEETLKMLLEAYKPYYQADDNLGDVFRRIGIERHNHLINGAITFYDTQSIWNFFEIASQVVSEGGVEMFAIPCMNGNVYATSSDTVAIRSGSPNQQNAWNFIKLLLSPQVQEDDIILLGMPVHKDSLIAKVEKYHNYFDGVVEPVGTMRNDGTITSTKLSEAVVQMYLDILLNIDGSITYRSRPVNNMLREHMTPYLRDEVSYDTAINRLRNQLSLYVSE